MTNQLVRAGTVEELRTSGRRVVAVARRPVLVLWHAGAFHALDNRCPHMGFPLSQGDVEDGLLDCHWHHARFDVTCGATLDPWADDVDSYAVVVRDGEVFVDPRRPPRDPRAHGLARLDRGLADDVPLVLAKAVVELDQGGVPPQAALARGAHFGATQRQDGWQPGLSVLAATANVLSALAPEDGRRALTHALGRIASDCAGRPPRRPLPALVGSGRDGAGLRAWLRDAIEVRDADAAERVLATICARHGSRAALDAVLAAASDHRYVDTGHTLDYAVKCAELCDHVSEDATDTPGATSLPTLLFTSLVPQLAAARRMEETSAWRRPVDVASIVASAVSEVGDDAFAPTRGQDVDVPLRDEEALVERLLDVDPAGAVSDLVRRLADGASPVALADAVLAAATLRVLRFGTANETPDWDTVHHTLTYANAVAEGMRRTPSPELFRSVLDGAMSVYLDRFLNVPPAPPPGRTATALPPQALLDELLRSYDRRGGMDEASSLAWGYLTAGGGPERLLATLAHAVLREDSGFHEFQQLECAWRRLEREPGSPRTRLALTAAARWVASQYPTRRAREQTFDIATRLHRGESLAEPA